MHWEAVLKGIEEAGLWSLVAETSEEAFTKLRRQAEEGITIDSFEPGLMASYLLSVRLHEAQRGAPGHRRSCPVCVLGEESIRSVLDEVLEQWKAIGGPAT